MVSCVQGHTASSFTVLIKENELSPNSPNIIQNDSIIWFNIDNSSNLTHRVVYDHDGDGLYNGTYDWDSGELKAYCERDENNTKVDPSCSDTFMVIFDLNWSVGNYTYQNIRSDNVTFNGTIQLSADTEEHVEPGLPNIGSQFGVNDNNVENSEDLENQDGGLTPEKLLLYVGLFTGISSLGLIVLLLKRKSNVKNYPTVDKEAE